MSISRVSFTMVGRGPILFGKQVFEPKRDDESHEQFDKRTWKMRCHTLDGVLAISSTAVHRSLLYAGSWLSMKLSGNKTYTKRLESGLLTTQPYFKLQRDGKDLTIDDCVETPLAVPSDGKRGGTKRVVRTYPVLPCPMDHPWTCDCQFLVTDNVITEDVLQRHAYAAGMYDGIGSMRIGKGGPNGMWSVKDLTLEPFEL